MISADLADSGIMHGKCRVMSVSFKPEVNNRWAKPQHRERRVEDGEGLNDEGQSFLE